MRMGSTSRRPGARECGCRLVLACSCACSVAALLARVAPARMGAFFRGSSHVLRFALTLMQSRQLVACLTRITSTVFVCLLACVFARAARLVAGGQAAAHRRMAPRWSYEGRLVFLPCRRPRWWWCIDGVVFGGGRGWRSRVDARSAAPQGFGDSMNWTTGDVCAWFASVGYEVHGIDYEAHGRSDGLAGLISSFDRVVDDVRAHFAGARAGAAARGLASFIFGESLGGAVAIHITQRDGPGAWAGAIFCAPMVKISDAMKPPACVISLLRLVERVAPTLQVQSLRAWACMHSRMRTPCGRGATGDCACLRVFLCAFLCVRAGECGRWRVRGAV